MSGKKSTFQIRQNYLAPVGFLLESDFCWIWKKCLILAEAEIWYRPNDYQIFTYQINVCSCFYGSYSIL